jgi:DNA-directed RNA polymerase specialized sigma24 family protein
MANFPNVRDDRWRPDLESSQRRVREEEHDEREPKVVYSRELSFVPGRRKQFEAHDAQTRALIRQLEQLERLPCGGEVNALLEDWHWLDSMGTPEAKQQFLEPKIAAVRQDPHANKHLLIFLALVFEPVRRSVSKAFVDVQGGLRPQPRDLSWGNREEARRIQEIDRQSLFDVTREAALEAIFRYPTPAPPKFFPWLRETIAHRALDHLKADLAELPTCAATRAEAEAMQLALAGFERLDGPPLRDGKGLRAWRDQFRMRDVFDVVEEFFRHDPVRRACQEAVGRLPRAQREIIDGYFFHELDVPTLASARGVSESTVYNQKAVAQQRMEDDDVFFSALYSLSMVRDRARIERLQAAYPNGRLPDGRRVVVIETAA